MNNDKKPFYVFLEVDGVLFDTKSNFHYHGPYYLDVIEPFLKPSSIDACNNLLKSLETEYNTKLVIISRRRCSMSKCISYIKHYGLKYDKPIFSTKFIPGARGKKIIDFMQNDGINNIDKIPSLNDFINYIFSKSETDEKFKNYVVINPTKHKIRFQIPNSHIIKTNPINNSLNQEQVDKFLKSINISTSQPEK